MSSSSTLATKPPPKRIPMACVHCRARKVKCRSPGEDQPCERCVTKNQASNCRYEPISSDSNASLDNNGPTGSMSPIPVPGGPQFQPVFINHQDIRRVPGSTQHSPGSQDVHTGPPLAGLGTPFPSTDGPYWHRAQAAFPHQQPVGAPNIYNTSHVPFIGHPGGTWHAQGVQDYTSHGQSAPIGHYAQPSPPQQGSAHGFYNPAVPRGQINANPTYNHYPPQDRRYNHTDEFDN